LSRRIFDWFAPKRGEEVLGMMERHLELTKSAVQDLYTMVEAAADCRQDECEMAFANVSRWESEADTIRRDMVEALTKSEMFPEERDDMMELVRAVDWIADSSKEAGRVLNILKFDKAPTEMKVSALNMCKANRDCVSILADCIKVLPNDSKEAINLGNEVELLEEDIDELYSVARRDLANLEFPGFNTGSMILLSEFLSALENLADWCENTADIVRAVAVRMH
jgi:predicted phosphate transport protein (TIGR00153 family)